jgi:hypothetical protein
MHKDGAYLTLAGSARPLAPEAGMSGLKLGRWAIAWCCQRLAARACLRHAGALTMRRCWAVERAATVVEAALVAP